MKLFSILTLALACLLSGVARAGSTGSIQDQKQTWDFTNHLTQDDFDFFFDSISFRDGEWHFQLSTNAFNMHWRIWNPDLDITGVCSSGESLDLEPGSSLQITRDDFTLTFHPIDPTTFQVYLRVKPAEGDIDDVRARQAILEPSLGGYRLAFGVE